MQAIALEPRDSTGEGPLSRDELEAALRTTEAENRALAHRLAELRPALQRLSGDLAASRRETKNLRRVVQRLEADAVRLPSRRSA